MSRAGVLLVCMLTIAALAGCGSGGAVAIAAQESSDDRVIVTLDDPEDDDEIEELRQRFAGLSLKRIGESAFFVLQVPPGTDLAELLKELNDDLRVVGADFDYFGGAPEGGPADVPILGSDLFSTIPTQPAFAALDLPTAHSLSMGGGVVVAVIDTGIDFGHPFLGGRIAPGGFDFVDGDADPQERRNFRDDDGDGLIDEQYGHGTFVASLVLVVAPNAMILPIRVLNDDGVGTASSVAAGISWAVDHGAKVINISVDIPQSPDVVKDSVDRAQDAGVVIVAAAGNDGGNRVIFPARYGDVIAVTAVDATRRAAPFANSGSEIDFVAPGVALLGAMPLDKSPSGTAHWSGTSFAAPIVAGAAALVRSRFPFLDQEEVRQRLKDAAQSVNAQNPSLAGNLGNGLVMPALALR